MLPLNDKEQAIIELVCKGKTNQEIAQIVGHSTPVVGGKLRIIYAKLDAHNRAEASANYMKRQR
jgi:DNA-binding CsgD family transcriptional regulator